MLCSVCRVNPSSYKCPKCKEPYCCINCFKIHKTDCKGEPLNNNDRSHEKSFENQENAQSISPFEMFRSHPKIISALGDPRLQKLITKIDSASDREAELVKEMEINSDFRKFVEQLISVAPPSIRP